MTAAFEARAVTKHFGGLTAVNRVDFALESGIASIIGPNGAGKTTLFNIFTGIYKPDQGSITFQGRSLVGLRPDQITALGICRTRTGRERLASHAGLQRVACERAEHVDEVRTRRGVARTGAAGDARPSRREAREPP